MESLESFANNIYDEYPEIGLKGFDIVVRTKYGNLTHHKCVSTQDKLLVILHGALVSSPMAIISINYVEKSKSKTSSYEVGNIRYVDNILSYYVSSHIASDIESKLNKIRMLEEFLLP